MRGKNILVAFFLQSNYQQSLCCLAKPTLLFPFYTLFLSLHSFIVYKHAFFLSSSVVKGKAGECMSNWHVRSMGILLPPSLPLPSSAKVGKESYCTNSLSYSPFYYAFQSLCAKQGVPEV